MSLHSVLVPCSFMLHAFLINHMPLCKAKCLREFDNDTAITSFDESKCKPNVTIRQDSIPSYVLQLTRRVHAPIAFPAG